jgi:hypothetical protein
VPHGKTLPPEERQDSILYALQHHGGLTNYWLAGRAGYEDGVFPDGPQWGPPGPAASWKAKRVYRRSYRKGFRIYRYVSRATPEQLAAAHAWLGNQADDAGPEHVCQEIDRWYGGGWKRFVRDLGSAGDAPMTHHPPKADYP